MATLETRVTNGPPLDEAVFVAHDGRRARRLRRAAVVATLVAALWVVGLGIGMLGFDSLPGVSLVKGSHAASPVAPIADVPATAIRDTARALLASKAAAAAAVEATQTESSRAGSSARAPRRASRNAAHSVTQPAAPPAALNPAQRTRGWARKGNTAPPGQLRRATAPPPAPATSRGRHVGQTKTPPAPVVPPGQARKALEPPPPPPPPKKG
jgi:hypothetical protein